MVSPSTRDVHYVSHFRYPPNFQPTDGHSHREQEEVYVVLGGSGKVRLNDDVMDVKQWDVVRVAPSTIRGFAAGADGGRQRPAGGRRRRGSPRLVYLS